MSDNCEKMEVTPMPKQNKTFKEERAPGHQYRTQMRARRYTRILASVGFMGLLWKLTPNKPEERENMRSSMMEYLNKRDDFKGIVDLEIHEELESVGQYQRRQRWLGNRIPVINEAARELGFDVDRYPWNYDRRPPDCFRLSPTMASYLFRRKFLYTPEEIAEIDRLYWGKNT